jgi:hypothetical protein
MTEKLHREIPVASKKKFLVKVKIKIQKQGDKKRKKPLGVSPQGLFS